MTINVIQIQYGQGRRNFRKFVGGSWFEKKRVIPADFIEPLYLVIPFANVTSITNADSVGAVFPSAIFLSLLISPSVQCFPEFGGVFAMLPPCVELFQLPAVLIAVAIVAGTPAVIWWPVVIGGATRSLLAGVGICIRRDAPVVVGAVRRRSGVRLYVRAVLPDDTDSEEIRPE